MSRRLRPAEREARVFVNMPYGLARESRLVAFTAALVALGRVPQLTFLVTDGGQGRMQRIFDLIRSCRVSLHDLSAAGLPVRFNMPFELGLACAWKNVYPDKHDFLMIDAEAYQLQRRLSDVNGIDYKLHDATVRGAIRSVLEVLERSNGRANPTVPEVMRLHRAMMRAVPRLKHHYATNSLFTVRAYGDLVFLASELSTELGL